MMKLQKIKIPINNNNHNNNKNKLRKIKMLIIKWKFNNFLIIDSKKITL